MGLTSEQLAARVYTVGASDVPAILGVHPWRSPIDVWMEKAPPGGKPPVTVEPRESEATQMGDDFEEVALRKLAQQYGVALMRDRQTFAHPENGRLTATPDALACGFGDLREEEGHQLADGFLGCAEAKLVGPGPAKHWTDPETKEPTLPDYVRAQALWQLGVTGLPVNYVGGVVTSTTWRHFQIHADDAMFGEMREIVERFLVDHVDAGVPPPRALDEDRIEYLRKRYPRSDGTLHLVDSLPPALAELAREYARIGEKIASWEHEQQECKAAILELVAERDGFKGPWGTLSFKTQRGRAQYKQIAEFLSGGEIREDLLERFRGADFRVFRCNLK